MTDQSRLAMLPSTKSSAPASQSEVSPTPVTRRQLREARDVARTAATPPAAPLQSQAAPLTRRERRERMVAASESSGSASGESASVLGRRIALGLGLTGTAALTGCSVAAKVGGGDAAAVGLSQARPSGSSSGTSFSAGTMPGGQAVPAQPVQVMRSDSSSASTTSPAPTSSSPSARESKQTASSAHSRSARGTKTADATPAAESSMPAEVRADSDSTSPTRRSSETSADVPRSQAGRGRNPSTPSHGRDESAAQTDTPPLKPGKQYSGFAAAAAAASPIAAGPHNPDLRELHLLRRASFGPGPGDLENLKRVGIDAWLSEQLNPGSIADPEGEAAWSLYPLAGAPMPTIVRSIRPYSGLAQEQTALATLGRQIHSRRQLHEVATDVFANHLHVPMPSESWSTSPDYLVHVVRRHALGRFEDMLMAAMRHPAMLRFLDNTMSGKNGGMNENLGRELLELHTVGPAAGFTEHDVRDSAKILSGRSLSDPDAFTWRSRYHITGPVKVLGFSHPNSSAANGLEVGDAYLRYLAHHPATARNVCRKLAVRFVADRPSADLIDRLSKVYLDSGTDIAAVLRAIFSSTDFWNAVGAKYRRPLEDLVGTVRAIGTSVSENTRDDLEHMYKLLGMSGHAPFNWSPPDGYPDTAAAWMSPGNVLAAWRVHRLMLKRLGTDGWPTARGLAPFAGGQSVGEWVDETARRLLGEPLSERHRESIIELAGWPEGSPSTVLGFDKRLRSALVAVMFDSPYFLLR